MKFVTHLQNSEAWPTLAWVARYDPNCLNEIRTWIGRGVETGPEFVVEGVWPDIFEDAAFDQSSMFFGSGIRVRNQIVRFVSSCSTVDRLWCHRDGAIVHFSNSLPSLLAVAQIDLIAEEDRYAYWIQTIVRGQSWTKELPVDRGALSVHYMEDLELCDGSVTTVSKPSSIEEFDNFSAYRHFMYDSAAQLGNNARSAGRATPVKIISTVSRGYDSPVATLMAREAGGISALTLASARSLLPRSDSGMEICRQLDFPCREFPRDPALFRDELYYWAANGSMQDMNLSILHPLPNPSILFTGFNGGQVWELNGRDSGDPLARKDTTGLGFCEHRLHQGVIHCPVPFWGITLSHSIRQISAHRDMKPWRTGGNYDRPIPRRLLEEAGIKRGTFATSKGATSVDELMLWPMSEMLSLDYHKYLTENGLQAPSWHQSNAGRAIIDFWRAAARARIGMLAGKVGIKWNWNSQYPWERHTFAWAVTRLRQAISASLAQPCIRTSGP